MTTYLIYAYNFILMFAFTWIILSFFDKLCTSGDVSFLYKFLSGTILGGLCIFMTNYSSTLFFNAVVAFYVLMMFFLLFTIHEFNTILYFTNCLVLSILSVRIIVSCIISLITKKSIYTINTTGTFTSELSLTLTVLILISIILILWHLISDEMIFNISIRSFAKIGINIWVLISNIYLLTQINSSFYNNKFNISILREQLLSSVILLIACWTFLYYNLNILKLLRYKDENVRMQKLTDGLTSNAVYRFNVNLSRDSILSSSLYGTFDDCDSYSEAVTRVVLRYANPKDADKMKETLNKYNLILQYEKGTKKIEFEARIKGKNGKYVWYHINVVLTCEERSTDIYAYLYATDIQERMSEKESLSKAATTDGLTGLLNKVTTLDMIDKQIKFGGALFIIDVDNFKHVNDNYGHATGDLILKAIAEQIQYTFRKDDILGRYGGDEFIAFIPSKNITIDRLNAISFVLCDRCHNSLNVDVEGNFSISVGVAMALPQKFNSFEEAFKVADKAVYESKEKGKGTYTIF